MDFDARTVHPESFSNLASRLELEIFKSVRELHAYALLQQTFAVLKLKVHMLDTSFDIQSLLVELCFRARKLFHSLDSKFSGQPNLVFQLFSCVVNPGWSQS